MSDLDAARDFVTTHARLLDRRRLAVLVDGAGAAGALDALAAYRNADGGFGWGLEPDLRSAASQPAGALHAFEVLADVAPQTSPLAGALCDWLAAAALPGGGLPFSVAGAAGPGTAPWWAGADPAAPSLHITSAVCIAARRVAAHDPVVAAHPWLADATRWCWEAVGALREARGTYELRNALQFLDAVAGSLPGAEDHLERLAAFVPASWERPVQGGVEGERLLPLDFAPLPGGPLRALVPADVIARDLDRLAAGQRADGGWEVDFAPGSPAAELEWRGYATVHALRVLRANGRL
ncbi:MAG TPA: hypothetical protein VD931_04695 [Baekduia sp.]|nr:hypothetical protein [Baekduia sp.]